MNQSTANGRAVATFHIAGLSGHADSLKLLANLNPAWNLSPNQIISSGNSGKKIYRLKFLHAPVNIQKDTSTGALNIFIDGHHIGYIKPEETAQARHAIKNFEIHGISCGICGGQYRVVDESGTDSTGQQNFSAILRIAYSAPPAPDVQSSKSQSASKHPRSATTHSKSTPNRKSSKPFYKRWWFLSIIVLLLLSAIGSCNGSDSGQPVNPTESETVNTSDVATQATFSPTSEPLPETKESTLAPATVAAETTSAAEASAPPATVSESVIQTTSPSETETESADGITFVSYPETISRGNVGTVEIKGAPKTDYSITVLYKSGPSTADGLETKTSDADGNVSWSWKIGSKTSPGTYSITVRGGGYSETVRFTITK